MTIIARTHEALIQALARHAGCEVDVSAQSCSGWAVCSDNAGIMLHTASYTRRGAIKNFLDTLYCEGRHSYNDWRRAKKKGWRVSHIIVDELIFTARTQP